MAATAIGRAHFEALAVNYADVGDGPARYVVARNINDLLANIQGEDT